MSDSALTTTTLKCSWSANGPRFANLERNGPSGPFLFWASHAPARACGLPTCTQAGHRFRVASQTRHARAIFAARPGRSPRLAYKKLVHAEQAVHQCAGFNQTQRQVGVCTGVALTRCLENRLPAWVWRRGWDSNPRYSRGVNRISSPAHSTTLPPLRCATKVYLRVVVTPDVEPKCRR